jgi:hypothetical protein
MSHAVYETEGHWTFMTPIAGLELTDAVNKEFRVDRVLLVAADKLPRIRKRLGLHQPVSAIKSPQPYARFFEETKTFAVVRQKGKTPDIRAKCFRLVRDELSVLALSQLGYRKRSVTGYVGLKGEIVPGGTSHLFLNKDNPLRNLVYSMSRFSGILQIDERWKRFQNEVFFMQLLKILQKRVRVSVKWREDLRRASILVGQSINSNDVTMSFLWNMIALELLLTQQGEKYIDTLPKRVEAFLGWIGFWSMNDFESKIREAYKKRSAFVHDGNNDQITKQTCYSRTICY